MDRRNSKEGAAEPGTDEQMSLAEHWEEWEESESFIQTFQIFCVKGKIL